MSPNNSEIIFSRQDSKEIYILPKFPANNTSEDPSASGNVELDLVIITSSTKDAVGYKGNICLKTLSDASTLPQRSGVLDEIKKALFEKCDYGFEIVKEVPAAEDLTVVLLSSRKDKIVSVPLEKISSSEALSVLASITSIMSRENDQTTSSWESKFLKSDEKVKSTEDRLRKLIIEKNLMEDHMYRAFQKCLNAKKDRIKQLLDELNKKKSTTQVPSEKSKPVRPSPFKKTKKLNVLDSSDSDNGSDLGGKKLGHSSDSDDFDFDTDTDTEMSVPPNPKRGVLIGNQRAKSKPVQKLDSTSPNDSQNDSFPEFPVTRKLRSTNNQLKLNHKATAEKRSYDDDEFNFDTNHTVDESKESHSPKKQPKNVEVVDLEVMYDCDKLMDEI